MPVKRRSLQQRLRVFAWNLREDARETMRASALWLRVRWPRRRDIAEGVVVSLTSFPARIAHTWIAVSSMLAQSVRPERVVLVLADEEFPQRRVPRSLARLERYGLEILWISRNGRSYNKLVPTYLAFPDSMIVTVDDDVMYGPDVLTDLMEASNRSSPDCIIGMRGWSISCNDGVLLPYIEWQSANTSTPSERTFLTGVGAILYPPGCLDPVVLADVDLSSRLCPNADDIWFWAVSVLSGSRRLCLKQRYGRPLRRTSAGPALEIRNHGGGENDAQFAAVVEHLGLRLPE
jgi:hypothetical protein